MLNGLTKTKVLVLWLAALVAGACLATLSFDVDGAMLLAATGVLVLAFIASVCTVLDLSDSSSDRNTTTWDDLFDSGAFDGYTESIPAPALILNATGKVVSCNFRAQQILGLDDTGIVEAEFAVGDGTGPVMPNRMLDAEDDIFRKLMLDDQRIFISGKHLYTGHVSFVPIGLQGTEKVFNLVLISPNADAPKPYSVPTAIEAREELRLHDDDRLLLRELNYDLRTRFQNASGILDLASAPGSGLEENAHVRTLQKIYHEAVGRLDSLVSFLEIDSKHMKENLVTFGLDELLNDISFVLGQSHDIENNEILFDTDQSVAKSLTFHRELLVKIVYHLVLHTVGGEQGKTVLVRVRLLTPDDESSELSVEVLTKDKGARTSIPDMSLDLEIARRITTQLGGELFVDHKYQQFAGTVFKAPVERIATFEAGFVVPSHLKNLRVLIVDDNEASREVFQQLATVIGWNADVAASGEAALHMMQFKHGLGEPYDVLLIDWRMKGLDGWETSKQVREMQVGGATPIIVMISAHNRSFLSKNVEDRGRILNGFLTKPVTLTMLLDSVADATAHIQEPVFDPTVKNETAEALSGNTVLIVDDNQMHREVAKEFMSRSGAKVLTATGGYDAISAIQKNRDKINVVLMDVHMPDLNGFDTVQRIRQLGFEDIPILMMTANNTSGLHHRSLESGANDVVIKPFVMREIVNAMSAHVIRAKQRKSRQASENLSPELLQLAENLDFNTDAITEHFGGRISGYVNALEAFVTDANRLLDALGDGLNREALPDIVRETLAISGMVSIIGPAKDAKMFKDLAQDVENILSHESEAENPASHEVIEQLLTLTRTRISAVETLLEQIETTDTETE